MELLDSLAKGDQALNKALLEMEHISCNYMLSSRTYEKMKVVGLLKQELQHA